MNVFVSYQHKAIVLPWRPDFQALLPHARPIVYDGANHLVVPHDLDNTRLLRNVDVPVPSPILSNYDWPGGIPPWHVQKETAALLTVSPRCYVLSEMRTGKSRSVLYGADYLLREGKAKRVLIVAPLSTLNVVWAREIMSTFGNRRTFAVLHGNRTKRLERLAQDVDIYIINYDGIDIISEELMRRTDIDCVIIDEVAGYRDSQTKRWKAMRDIVAMRKYVWGLTGKPTPNAPTDAYGIGKLITPDRMPRYFKTFREQTMMRVSTFRWVAKKEANSIVHDALKPSVRFTRSDIAESPPTLYLDRECTLSPTAEAAMKKLLTDLRIELANGNITASNSGVLVGKLMQIATGWVYDDKGNVIDMSSPTRLQAVIDVLNGTDRKVLVFVPYVHAVENVAAKLAKAGFDTCKVYGSTPSKERDEIFSLFQNTDRYDVMVAHPACMAHGLLLTAADTVVWYGAPPSNETYAQANDRVALPGLSYPTAVVHITGHAVERRRYGGLRRQEALHEQLLDMLEGIDNG